MTWLQNDLIKTWWLWNMIWNMMIWLSHFRMQTMVNHTGWSEITQSVATPLVLWGFHQELAPRLSLLVVFRSWKCIMWLCNQHILFIHSHANPTQQRSGPFWLLNKSMTCSGNVYSMNIAYLFFCDVKVSAGWAAIPDAFHPLWVWSLSTWPTSWLCVVWFKRTYTLVSEKRWHHNCHRLWWHCGCRFWGLYSFILWCVRLASVIV